MNTSMITYNDLTPEFQAEVIVRELGRLPEDYMPVDKANISVHKNKAYKEVVVNMQWKENAKTKDGMNKNMTWRGAIK